MANATNNEVSVDALFHLRDLIDGNTYALSVEDNTPLKEELEAAGFITIKRIEMFNNSFARVTREGVAYFDASRSRLSSK